MSNYPPLIYLGGVPGSGKTTLGRAVSGKLQGLEYISSGEIKGPESRARFGKSLSLLDQEESFQINAWFLNKLKQEKSTKPILVDTHYTYPIQGQDFVRLLPEECIEDVNLFVLVEADVEEILRRRVNRGRNGDSIDISFIKRELSEERDEAYRTSFQFGKQLIPMYNQGRLEDTIERFIGFLIQKYFP